MCTLGEMDVFLAFGNGECGFGLRVDGFSGVEEECLGCGDCAKDLVEASVGQGAGAEIEVGEDIGTGYEVVDGVCAAVGDPVVPGHC